MTVQNTARSPKENQTMHEQLTKQISDLNARIIKINTIREQADNALKEAAAEAQEKYGVSTLDGIREEYQRRNLQNSASIDEGFRVVKETEEKVAKTEKDMAMLNSANA